jgi:Domain of unknown function (DUF5615)
MPPRPRTHHRFPGFQPFPSLTDPSNRRRVLRILCVEQVPSRLINALGRRLARARNISDTGLRGRTDHDVLRWCIKEQHCLLTFDQDFLQRGFDWWRSPGVFVCRIASDKPHLWLPIYKVIVIANRAPSLFLSSLSVIGPDGFKYHYKDRGNRTRINDFRWFKGQLHRRIHLGEHLLDQGWAVSDVNEALGQPPNA